MEQTKIRNIEDFKVYQKAKNLFEEFLEVDLPILKESFAGRTLATNQLRCLDSICANMEEGYDRKFGKEVKYFFRMARGSSTEARGRYTRLKGILPDDLITKRVGILNEVRAMLASLITKWE